MTVPQPGDFGVVNHRGGGLLNRIAEWAIEFGTQAPVDHAFIYVGHGEIVEAVRHVRVSPASNYPGTIWSTGRLPGHLTPTATERAAIIAAALSYVGESYNVLDILAIALAQRRLGRPVNGDEWWVKRLSNDGSLICSQLVSAAYAKAGIELCPGKLAGLISPGDLYGLLLPA